MKKLFTTFSILLLFIINITAQDTVSIANEKNIILPLPKVDKRVELISIVFRLAGENWEYNFEDYKSYVKDIHVHFDKFIEHPVVKFAKELRDKNGIGFHKPMSLAIHLEQPPSLRPIIPFEDNLPDGWSADNANKFDSLLQKFYTDANCEDFFNKHEQVYNEAENKYKKVYDAIDFDWFKEYYGKIPVGKFYIVICLGNGPCNYASNYTFPDNKQDIYDFAGTTFDSLGKLEYDVKSDLPLLIHEFSHSFCNPLIDNNNKQLEKFGKVIFKQQKDIMTANAYGHWVYMMHEALVRASVIRYQIKHDTDKNITEEEIREELTKGFIWMRELVELLDQYENNRSKYPTLESFMPQIISFYQSTAKNIKILKEKLPHVISIQPFKNKSKNVDTNITEIKVCFDKPLIGKGHSFNFNDEVHNPITNFIGYSDDNKKIILKVALKPNWEYQFVLLGYAFKTIDGYPLESYEIKFKTRK